MELFPASDALWKLITGLIEESDFYVLIIGGRYGSIPDGEPISYTEKEYNHAIEKEIPVLAFLRYNYKKDITYLEQTPEEKSKMDAFVAKLDKNSINFWTNKYELGEKLATTLPSAIAEYNRTGWKRNVPNKLERKLPTSFICFYYSFKHHEVRSFDLTLWYVPNASKNGYYDFDVEEKGLHEGELRDFIYKGKGSIGDNFLYIDLEGSKGNRLRITLILGQGLPPSSIKNIESAFGQYHGISSKDGFLINGEIVAVRKKNKSELVANQEVILSIKRYLMVQRVNFRVKNQTLGESLQSRYIDVADISHIVGCYRLITPLRDGKKMLQSLLVIEKDYKAYLHTNYEIPGMKVDKIQVCLLRFSFFHGIHSKLSITMHENKGIRVFSNAIVDMPTRESDLEKVFIGSYCSIGKSPSSYAARKKRKQNESTPFPGTRAGYFLGIYYGETKGDCGFDIGEITIETLEREDESGDLRASKLLNQYKEKMDFFK